jgi:hypothetical protein
VELNNKMDIVDTLVEIKFNEEEDFLKIKETLTRIGIASKKTNTLYQSCHILHKKGKYYLLHFKELFALDGKTTDITEDDIARRNTIAALLGEWGLCEIVTPDKIIEPRASMSQIKILPYKEKESWNLESKYSIGKSKKG